MMKEKFEKAKKWVKEHKVEIALTVTGAAIPVVVWYLGKNRTSDINDINIKEIAKSTLCNGAVNGSEIDEKIFTDLACQIEDAVLEEGLDEAYLSEIFDVNYAKSGDLANGVYTASKKVEVIIRDMTD